MWGCTRGRTPAARRTGYDLVAREPAPAPSASVLAQRPALTAGASHDAVGEWLAHLDAGRIEVR